MRKILVSLFVGLALIFTPGCGGSVDFAPAENCDSEDYANGEDECEGVSENEIEEDDDSDSRRSHYRRR